MPPKKFSYETSGVSYEAIDRVKRLAQTSSRNISLGKNKNYSEIAASRGESAYVVRCGDYLLATVIEGLGTKSLVADEMRRVTGKTYYDSLAQDTVAMIVNDLITVGATPTTVLAYWAAGSSKWFADIKRAEDLISGWVKACKLAGATWGAGETPVLDGVIEKQAIDLAGAATGIINPKSRLTLGEKVKAGDEIIVFASSGIHANGITLARKIIQAQPQGLATKIENGQMFGEAILAPTVIYASLVEKLFSAGIDIHYMVNITGHGWRKLMRLSKPFTYRINYLPPVPEVLQFIVNQGVSEEEAYRTFNMGAGFAIFISKKDIDRVLDISKKSRIKAYKAGFIENGPRQVVIEPKNLIFPGESLQIR